MLLIKPYQPCNILSGLVDLTSSDQFYGNVTQKTFLSLFFLILNSQYQARSSLYFTLLLIFSSQNSCTQVDSNSQSYQLFLFYSAHLNDSVGFSVRPCGPDRLTKFGRNDSPSKYCFSRLLPATQDHIQHTHEVYGTVCMLDNRIQCLTC